ncbi:MAG: transporter associated domain-containing protein [Buchnera aphidicola (Tetraneura akinire)]
MFHPIRNEDPKNKKELIKIIKNAKKNKIIDLDTRKMLEGVLNIYEKRVHQIMIPRTKMVTLDFHCNFKTCINTIIKSSHSRYPVMSKDKNYVKGILIAKDLLPFMYKNSKNFHIKKILRPAIVVPESKFVNLMLKEFRSKKRHLSIVIDEFGIVSGLVTIEDVLELIVGEIKDEYDKNNMLIIHQINKKSFKIPGIIEIKEFNKIFKTNFDDREVDTIGGLIMKKLGRLPKKGEKISIKKHVFIVSISDSRKIIQVKVLFPNEKKISEIKKN